MISIVVPTYNRVASLQKCVQSILLQHYEGLELVIVDDHSADGSRAYLQELRDTYPYVSLVFNGSNQGVNFSRNRGIESARNPYILFLDSDDELAPGSLAKAKQVLMEYPNVKHFLFTVSDRSEEFRHLDQIQDILYADWVSGNVTGDFTHLVDAAIMKKYLFFEHFRMYEHLNWLRVKKTTSPQLLVPLIVAQRERNRTDSLTSAMKLQDITVIRSKFESEKLFYSLYYNDLCAYSPQSLKSQLLHAIVLGTACNQRNDCRSLMKYGKLPVQLLALLIMCFPSSFLEFGIVKYSQIKSRQVLK